MSQGLVSLGGHNALWVPSSLQVNPVLNRVVGQQSSYEVILYPCV